MDALDGWIIGNVRRAAVIGRVLAQAGFALLALGAIGFAIRRMLSVTVAGVRPQAPTLETVFGIPLFWLPESILGFAFAGLIAIAGLTVLQRAKRLSKAYDLGRDD